MATLPLPLLMIPFGSFLRRTLLAGAGLSLALVSAAANPAPAKPAAADRGEVPAIEIFKLRPSAGNPNDIQDALAALDAEIGLLEAANARRKGGVREAAQERIDAIKAARTELAANFSAPRWQAALREVFNAMEVDRVGQARLDDQSLWNLSQNPLFVSAGQATVMFNCIPCHLPNLRGKGETGEAFAPDLTDHWWIHGGRPSEILAFITHGAPMKGMPGWGDLIGPKKVAEAAAFVLSKHQEGEPVYEQARNEPVATE